MKEKLENFIYNVLLKTDRRTKIVFVLIFPLIVIMLITLKRDGGN